jgi:DeoR/GlpR family transcriptional regulator of sugar metabolism
MIENAAEVSAVSSADKLGSAGAYVIAPLSELTYLVTEESVASDQLAEFRSAGVEVVLA